jgi:uncharacterized protein GlcG (DUF336 family)
MSKFIVSEFFRTSDQSFNSYFQVALLTEATTTLVDLEMNCSGSLCYSISDKYGNIVAKITEDFALPRSIQLADQKARTAALFGTPTEIVDDKRIHSLNASTNLCGGYPIFTPTGDLVGGFGVSGGTEEEDQFVSRYLLYALNCYNPLKFKEELKYFGLVVEFGASQDYISK